MEILKFYTKPHCHLCDRVREVLEQFNSEWEEIDITNNPKLLALYRTEIPVIQSRKAIWFYREWDAKPLINWLKTHH